MVPKTHEIPAIKISNSKGIETIKIYFNKIQTIYGGIECIK